MDNGDAQFSDARSNPHVDSTSEHGTSDSDKSMSPDVNARRRLQVGNEGRSGSKRLNGRPMTFNSDDDSEGETGSRVYQHSGATFKSPARPVNPITKSKIPGKPEIQEVAGNVTTSTRTGDKSKRNYMRHLLEGFYNSEYRELLNADINDAVTRSQEPKQSHLPESQMGCSIWSPAEKESFFAALSQFGRVNVRAIACYIPTKSEIQVQEYMRLLQSGAARQPSRGISLKTADLPIAYEIDNECCELLEKSADAIAARQERYEVEVERTKWGESWLLTQEISHWLNKRRNLRRGEEAVNEVLPAANLFNLDTWLKLSERVFMNPTGSHDDQNWQSIAVGRERPAIRATAFEDFHSLASFITRKIVSTALFCTMSRERATHSHAKHSTVILSDVEAALNMLKMDSDSHDFWKRCAKRCRLQVIDEEAGKKVLSYEEVELALTPSHRRSRSRSLSQGPHTRASSQESHRALSAESSGEFESADESPQGYSFGLNNDISLSDDELHGALRPDTPVQLEKNEVFAHAQDQYTNSIDIQASRIEEAKLLKLMKRPSQAEVKIESLDEPAKPKHQRRAIDIDGDWRDDIGFRSEWELFERPILEEAFEGNLNLKRKRQASGISNRKRRRFLPLRSDYDDADDSSILDRSEDEEDKGIREITVHEEAESHRETTYKAESEDGYSSGIPNWPSDEDLTPKDMAEPQFQNLARRPRLSDDDMST